ncbi:lytic transglycosylase [Thermosipho melanesiensis]|uniref:Lytic transglycosylase, catalytic n=2 Tax=Thermosipho melanesiensis TaxID=46541 RepID=A6LNX8_THEM4|nr:Lytic transglycosylase, catalytic [Thermosipho melanesiensis BI429]APT74658.1 lytic transglycosylase [Thermosipho melanesiensis]OOC35157.1 lytic transglycosylase [Thermosipho melanesiensis]OOC35367.1 lytic transglycosylase [Thermosipho melanesiensis]OOC36618.1 lytic transglycosylase [Thermosipho melanesiensis]
MRCCFLVLSFFIMVSLYFLFNWFPFKYAEYINSDLFDRLLILSIINVESSFSEDAISPLGAYGLMQIMPETSKWLNEKFKTNYNVYNPIDNLNLGIMYLEYLYKRSGSLEKALVDYNTGPYSKEEIRKDAGGRYLSKVKKVYRIYRFLYRGD